MTEEALLAVAERVEAWYDDKGWGSPRDEAAQFAADIGDLLSHITQLQAKYEEARATRNALIQRKAWP